MWPSSQVIFYSMYGHVYKMAQAVVEGAKQVPGAEVSLHTTLLHHGMVIVGVPYSESGLSHMDDITGGTPYGATTLTGGDGSRQPSENELKIARYQGKHVTEIASRLFS